MNQKYNDNITLVDWGDRPLTQDNEYYALMVTDHKQGGRDRRKFFDEERGWLGLEETDGRIYISKKTKHSSNKLRGEAFVVRVNNPELCCILDY